MPATARLANDAWEALLTAHATLIREFASDDVWHDVSMREYDVLYTLSKCPGPVRLGSLNRHVLLSQPALSRLVDRLADRGLVRREPDPDDRRGVLLCLTAAGLRQQRAVGRRHAAAVARAVSSRLSRAQLQQLQQICSALATDERTLDKVLQSRRDDTVRHDKKQVP